MKQIWRARFHEVDVTHLVPSTPFTVSTSIFGDPAPGRYKYLEIMHQLSRRCVLVGEGDRVESDIVTMFETLQNIPPCKHIAPLPFSIRDQIGLEVGGPTEFMRPLGLYDLPKAIDNLHLFAPLGPFQKGKVIRGDAVDMPIDDGVYHFVFASHVLEHIRNPLKALCEIRRVLVPKGLCILILPYKPVTFDHRRPTTKLDELIDHFEKKETEHDVMDHVTQELLGTYDFSRDLPAKNKEFFVERCKDNFNNRLLHIHVFDFKLICDMFDLMRFDVLSMQLCDLHQIVVARAQ